MRVIIAGSRQFSDYKALESFCDQILEGKENITIISGGARGADRMGEHYAREKGLSVQVFPADWERHGRSAGYLRNKEMASNGDMLIAFWDGESKGTNHMINLAKEEGLSVHIKKI